MPDVQDAIKVVTAPAFLIPAGDTHSSMRMVNDKRAVDELRRQGAGRAEARALITEAVQELGGRVESEVRFGGRASGPDSRKATEIWQVPGDAVVKEFG